MLMSPAARSWEQYERETAALVEKHWPRIAAVATRLMKVMFIRGGSVPDEDDFMRR
jgi:hypothetical protein